MKSSLKTVYIDKIKLLNKYSEHYYQKNSPLVTDQQFDNLKKEIIELEKKYNFKSSNSPSLIVGFKPSKNFKKDKHRVPMLSLSNAFDRDDLENFQKRIINYSVIVYFFSNPYKCQTRTNRCSRVNITEFTVRYT